VEEQPVTEPAEDVPVLRFADGIPGFAAAHRFALEDLTDDGTFQLLASLDVADLSLVVASPWLFFPDYAPELPESDRRGLGIDEPDDVVLFCSVVADDDQDVLHLNLRAPFVANVHTREARQVVLHEDLPLRATVTAGG
jgi:flagellar assembly factor FliW